MIKIKMFTFSSTIIDTKYLPGRHSLLYVTNTGAGFYKFSPEPVYSFGL